MMSTLLSNPENAPQNCPGTGSGDAGRAAACQGCPNQSLCSSGKLQGPDPDIDKIQKNLEEVKHIVLVLSGKGGVGKSSVAANLARSLAASHPDSNVGLLDVDLCGPSLPWILGVQGETVHQSGSGWTPVYAEDNLALMSIGFILNSEEDAVIWRGPKKNGLIKQFLRDVSWGPLEFLVVDTPPGTTDEHISLVKYLKHCNLSGALMVTTPQEVALQDVRRQIAFCHKVSLPIVGVVENMNSFTCPKCQTPSSVFPASSGGALSLCQELNVNLLAQLPLDPTLAKLCDKGMQLPADHPLSHQFEVLAQKVKAFAEARTYSTG